jgi:transcriptional regulator with XRE-family HTH domain
MGKRARLKPERLAEKLVHIRNSLGLSQSEMYRRLGLEDLLDYKRISEYELGNSEPPLPVILLYARTAGVHMEALVDDELDLPDELPGTTRHETIKRQYAPRRKAKR